MEQRKGRDRAKRDDWSVEMMFTAALPNRTFIPKTATRDVTSIRWRWSDRETKGLRQANTQNEIGEWVDACFSLHTSCLELASFTCIWGQDMMTGKRRRNARSGIQHGRNNWLEISVTRLFCLVIPDECCCSRVAVRCRCCSTRPEPCVCVWRNGKANKGCVYFFCVFRHNMKQDVVSDIKNFHPSRHPKCHVSTNSS